MEQLRLGVGSEDGRTPEALAGFRERLQTLLIEEGIETDSGFSEIGDELYWVADDFIRDYTSGFGMRARAVKEPALQNCVREAMNRVPFLKRQCGNSGMLMDKVWKQLVEERPLLETVSIYPNNTSTGGEHGHV